MSPQIALRIDRSPLTQFTYVHLSFLALGSGSEIQSLFSFLGLLNSLWSLCGHVMVSSWGTSSVTRMRPTGPSVLAAHTRILAWTQKSPENKPNFSMICNGNGGYSTVTEMMWQFRYQAVSRILMLPSVHPVAPQQRGATLLLPPKHSQPFHALLTCLAKTHENKFKP